MTEAENKIIDELIDKKWNDPYLVDLALYDHIHEISILKDKFIECKNMLLTNDGELNTAAIDGSLSQELIDLYIILTIKYRISNSTNSIEKRLNKFMSKL